MNVKPKSGVELIAGRWEEGSGASHLARCTGLVLLFAALVTLVSLSHGVSLPLPMERVSPALGYNPALPLLVAVAGYLGGCAWKLAGIEPVGRPALLRRIRTDLAYLVLFVIVTYFHFVLKLQMPLLRQVQYDPLFFRWTAAWRRSSLSFPGLGTRSRELCLIPTAGIRCPRWGSMCCPSGGTPWAGGAGCTRG